MPVSAPFDLTGKVALVTGASRGLGQYMGRALARAGADLSSPAAASGPSRTLSRRSRFTPTAVQLSR